MEALQVLVVAAFLKLQITNAIGNPLDTCCINYIEFHVLYAFHICTFVNCTSIFSVT